MRLGLLTSRLVTGFGQMKKLKDLVVNKGKKPERERKTSKLTRINPYVKSLSKHVARITEKHGISVLMYILKTKYKRTIPMVSCMSSCATVVT